MVLRNRGVYRPSRALAIAALVLSVAADSSAQQTVSESATEQTTTVEQKHVPPPPSTVGRKKIGLVLEGGGALGLAHIGVIRWLEQNHIPVDDVAGTSMGGLVGGLYASGMGPDEIEAFVKGISWDRVLSGQVGFPELSYRRKEDKVAFPNRIELGLKGGISLPGGLNSGAAVNLLFDTTLLPYWDLHNFDDLPIPFRCVATELNTGQAHVFEDGPLPRALRSTMSIPGVFAPVHVGNDLYSDGAAVDNLPVDVAKSMGAEFIISSYLNAGPPKADSLDSLVGVAGRNVSIMVAGNEVNSLKNSNVVISSDVSKFGALEFSRSGEIIPAGMAAAELERPELLKYSLNDHDWAVYLAQRAARRRVKIPLPQFLEVANVQGAQKKEVEVEFEKFVGQPVDTAKIEKSIGELQGTSLYSTINYNIVDRNGRPGLLIRPISKSYGPPFMNFGLTILTNDSNDVQLGVGVRGTFFNLAGPGSELRLDGSVGQPAGLRGELFKPLVAGSRFFAAPHAYIGHQTMPYYQGSEQLDQYKERRNGLGLDLGYIFNSRLELRVGEDVQWFSENKQIGTESGNEFSIVPMVSKVRLQYLGQNDMMVPTSGSIALVTYNYYTKRPLDAPGGYSQMTGKLEHFKELTPKSNIFLALQGGTSFGADNLGLAGVATGGPFQLSAYARNELLGTDYFVGSVGYLHKMLQLNPVIADGVYLGASYELGKMYGGNAQTPSLPNSVSGFAVVKTLFGPVFGGVSIGDSDHRKWYFGLGRVF